MPASRPFFKTACSLALAAAFPALPAYAQSVVTTETVEVVGNTPLAGIVVGAAAPVVLTSRADSPANKLNSIALAVVVSGVRR